MSASTALAAVLLVTTKWVNTKPRKYLQPNKTAQFQSEMKMWLNSGQPSKNWQINNSKTQRWKSNSFFWVGDLDWGFLNWGSDSSAFTGATEVGTELKTTWNRNRREYWKEKVGFFLCFVGFLVFLFFSCFQLQLSVRSCAKYNISHQTLLLLNFSW